VTARDPERIRGKAENFGIHTIYDSYESMLADPLIDAIYVATPNHLHSPHAVQALRAGKHVLCEKPVCVTKEELDLLLAVAQEEHLLFLEGMWMRTLPMIRQLQTVVSSGAIGKLRLIQTRCCNSNSPERYPALYDAAQAGGAMMDVGCYALHFAQLFHPLDHARLSFAADLAPTGVDRSSTVTIASEDIITTLCQSIGAAGGAYAILNGTEGSIEVPLFLSPEQFTVISANGKRTVYHYPVPKSRRPIGYAYEILHFADLIRSGNTTPNLIPHSDTSSVLNIMVQFRRSCGIRIGSEL
jgi:predicted dehydrogenase